MHILRIEHPVPTFEAWKEAFDSDPMQRRASGVRGYRVMRPSDDPSYVLVDLEFDGEAEAEAFGARLRELWRGAEAAGIMRNPQARIVEVAESRAL